MVFGKKLIGLLFINEKKNKIYCLCNFISFDNYDYGNILL